MVAEKNNFSLMHNTILPRVKQLRKVTAPLPFKKTCYCIILPPTFLNFSNSPSPVKKRGRVAELCNLNDKTSEALKQFRIDLNISRETFLNNKSIFTWWQTKKKITKKPQNKHLLRSCRYYLTSTQSLKRKVLCFSKDKFKYLGVNVIK